MSEISSTRLNTLASVAGNPNAFQTPKARKHITIQEVRNGYQVSIHVPEYETWVANDIDRCLNICNNILRDQVSEK